MGKIKDKSLNDLLKRSVAEKILAVEKIWDSIAEESISENKKNLNIVKERMEDYRKNPSKKRSWEEFKKEFLKK